MTELERTQALLKGQRAALQSELDAKAEILAALAQRPAQIGEDLAAAKAELSEIEAGLNIDTAGQGVVAEARHVLDAARAANLSALVDDLERERTTITPREGLLNAETEAMTVRLASLDEAAERLSGLIQSSLIGEARERQAEAAALTEEAERTRLKGAADQNAALAEDLAAVASSVRDSGEDLATSRSDLARLKTSSDTAARIFATGTLNEELATLLRGIRARLPRASLLAVDATRTDEALVGLQLDTILRQERLAVLRGTESPIIKLDLTVENPTDDELELASRIVSQRSDIIERLIEVGDTRADLLRERQAVLDQAVTAARDLAATLDRRLLWLPTNAAIDGDWAARLAAGAAWFLRPGVWAGTAETFFAELLAKPIRAIVLFGVPLILIGLRPRMRERMASFSARVGDTRADRYWVSPAALLVTAFLTIPIPLLVGGVGGLLATSGEPGTFGRHLAAGIAGLSSILFVLFFFRGICRDDGLLACHFH